MTSTTRDLTTTLIEYVEQFGTLPTATILCKRANCRYDVARKFILKAQKEGTFSVEHILSSQSSGRVDGAECKTADDGHSIDSNSTQKRGRRPSGNLLIDAVVQITEEMLSEAVPTATVQREDVVDEAETAGPMTSPSPSTLADSTRSQLVAFGYGAEEIQNAVQSICSDHDINGLIAHIDRQREESVKAEIVAMDDVVDSAVPRVRAQSVGDGVDEKEESERLQHPKLSAFRRIDCAQLYNLQQNTFCAVAIDTRSAEEYGLCHLRNAVNIASGLSAEHIVDAMAGHLERSGKGAVSKVAVYSNDAEGAAASRHIEGVISVLREHRLCPADDAAVHVLDRNFSVFFSLFPFLCRSTVHRRGQRPQSLSSLTPRRRRKAESAMKSGLYPNQIIDDALYLGDRRSALTERVIVDLKVSHIVNATNAPPPDYPRDFTSSGFIKNKFEDRADLNLKYCRVPIHDISEQDIKGHFGAVHQFIDDALRQKGGRVLVHCFAGVSRSSTIVISYLMKYRKMTHLDAFHFVKARRDCVCPNPGFVAQLKAFETECALEDEDGNGNVNEDIHGRPVESL